MQDSHVRQQQKTKVFLSIVLIEKDFYIYNIMKKYYNILGLQENAKESDVSKNIISKFSIKIPFR